MEKDKTTMVNHECKQEEIIGRIKEFIGSMKDTKTIMTGIVVTIIIQVGSFLFLWGSLTTTVKKNSEHIWQTITPQTTENTRNIDKILGKIELITVTKAHAGMIKDE